jgi:magnesium chelatase subunit I
MVVGQDELKLALKLAYVAPRLGGVLISGQRGTGKSTAVRAFARMVYGRELPLVTLPINATEDRVVGGWKLDALMRGEPEEQRGLLEEADGRILYVDEVNLLDDHIVNIILDVASTGLLSIQREGRAAADKRVAFTLVGTMNPEEGNLRPQLLDRFGLMVNIVADPNPEHRRAILQSVLSLDLAVKLAREGEPLAEMTAAEAEDARAAARVQRARDTFYAVDVEPALQPCVTVASAFPMQGHRGDLVMLLAARALAALRGEPAAGPEHVRAVSRMALQHRRMEASQGVMFFWTPADDAKVCELLGLDPATPALSDGPATP